MAPPILDLRDRLELSALGLCFLATLGAAHVAGQPGDYVPLTVAAVLSALFVLVTDEPETYRQ